MTKYLNPKNIDELLALGPMPAVKNPYPIFRKLQEESPVFDVTKTNQEGQLSGNDYSVLITRYDDIKAVLKDDKTFGSDIVNRIMGLVMGPTIVGMNGKEHMKHRTLVTPSMATRILKGGSLAEDIKAIADSYIDKWIDNGKVDLHRDFCYSFPLAVFVSVLGLELNDSELEEFHDQSKGLCLVAFDPETGINSAVWLEKKLAPIIEEKRLNPGDDMISILVTSEVDGEKLSTLEVISFLRLLTLAGAETTNHVIGTSFIAMLEDPELEARVRADRSLIPKMMDEAMRFESPVATVMRESLCDTEIGGVAVKKGTTIICQLNAANRDPRQFNDPDVFDIDRTDNDPIPFGFGRHYCAGSHLAKMEGEIGINALLDRITNIKAQEGMDYSVIGYSFRGPDSVPVTFDKV